MFCADELAQMRWTILCVAPDDRVQLCVIEADREDELTNKSVGVKSDKSGLRSSELAHEIDRALDSFLNL